MTKAALCDLKCVKSLHSEGRKLIPRQTRLFYEAWCDFFQLDVEGEDPRIYDEHGQIEGLIIDFQEEWQIRKPWLAGMWKRNLEINSSEDDNHAGLQIMIVDVSWYYNKVEDLLKIIKDFQPNTLIIDLLI